MNNSSAFLGRSNKIIILLIGQGNDNIFYCVSINGYTPSHIKKTQFTPGYYEAYFCWRPGTPNNCRRKQKNIPLERNRIKIFGTSLKKSRFSKEISRFSDFVWDILTK